VAARASRVSPPTSSSLPDDEACLLAPPQHGGARFSTLATHCSRSIEACGVAA
jgi:hypothetical protein